MQNNGGKELEIPLSVSHLKHCIVPYISASANQPRRASYFVYCKTCKDITPGKLRVCCSRCHEGAMVLYQVWVFSFLVTI